MTVFVRRERSACPSSTARREPAVSPEKIDEVDDRESRSAEDDECAVEEVEEEPVEDERAASAGRGKGR